MKKLYQQAFGNSESRDVYSYLIERTQKKLFGNNDF
ncbi:hypothetical protein RS022_00330 [Candidatus Phytoplasma rubi]|uniref:Uncharacterized protein n=1 Tax=Candidatus Phytoplasma rubi TaxID=399025 RepID=A0ABY7BTD6_9MOLU|nr:hypothetical protein RS022_00330 [Candidatus Phytoplasma rubi]